MRRVKQVLARNPLAVLACAAMAGILIADATGTRMNLAWRFGLSMLAIAWTVWRPRAWNLVLTTTLVFGFIQGCRLEATRYHPLRSALPPGQPAEVIATGQFTRAPMTVETYTAPGRHEARFLADKVEVPSRGNSWVGATELRIWLKDSTFIPNGGRYEVRGSLTLPAPPTNPGMYDSQNGGLRQGFIGNVKAREIIAIGPPRFSLRLWLLAVAERSRHWIESALALGIEDDTAPRILIQTMALGTNEPGSEELQEPFRNSGTLHVFAVSGLHVSMLAAIGMMLLRPLGLNRNGMILVLTLLVLGYAFVTGWRPSAARAALMCCAMLWAPMVNRRSRPVNALGACALALLAMDPQELFQAGFQLSFGVVWAITACTRPMTEPFRPFTELDPFLPPQLASTTQRFGIWARREMVSIMAVSFIATLASLPIMLVEFHSVTPVGVIANCVLVPLAFLSLFTLVLSLGAAGVGLSSAQMLFNNANWFIIKGMTACATWFAALPGANFSVPYGNLPKAAPLTLSVLSMPLGEGAQLLDSSGQHWLLDVGGAGHAPHVLLPFLRHEGINRLDGIILSHADSGHVGALQDLMPRYQPPLVMTSLHEPWRLDSSLTLMRRAFGGHALDSAIAVKLRAGDKVPLGKAKIHILYPGPGDSYNKADDRAIVARIDCGTMRLLWCNDAGFITEKNLLARLPHKELASHVIIRNQHASDFSALPEFLSAVAPKLIITSNTPAVVEQRIPAHLTQYGLDHGVPLLDLSETGMVRLEVWDDHLEAKAWLTGTTIPLKP